MKFRTNIYSCVGIIVYSTSPALPIIIKGTSKYEPSSSTSQSSYRILVQVLKTNDIQIDPSISRLDNQFYIIAFLNGPITARHPRHINILLGILSNPLSHRLDDLYTQLLILIIPISSPPCRHPFRIANSLHFDNCQVVEDFHHSIIDFFTRVSCFRVDVHEGSTL